MNSLSLKDRANLWVKNRLARRINQLFFSRLGMYKYNENGVDVFAEDWDTLIILDACRYDIFEKYTDEIPGDLSKRESRSSSTQEFMQANVAGTDLEDTVCVTATPSYRDNGVHDSFYHIEDLWIDEWDSGLGVVRPEVVADASIRIYEQYPHKRQVIHFLQPHYPFIGEIGKEHFNYENVGLNDPNTSSEDDHKFWDTVGTKINDLPKAIVEEAYEENLKLVLSHVKRLLEEIEGKHVITADHGEMIFDRAWPIPVIMNGHPPGIYTNELIEVPWHTFTNGERRDIGSGTKDIEQEENVDEKVIKQRLQDLGSVET